MTTTGKTIISEFFFGLFLKLFGRGCGVGATKLVSLAFDFAKYTEIKKIARDNEMSLSEFVRRCVEIGMRKMVNKDKTQEG